MSEEDAESQSDGMCVCPFCLNKVEHCERQRGPLPQLDHTGGVGDLDVADCAVTVEECRGVIRRMEKRREKDLEMIGVLRKALAGLVGGEDEEYLGVIEWQLKSGRGRWVTGPTALAAVAALRKVGKVVGEMEERQRGPLPKLDQNGGVD